MAKQTFTTGQVLTAAQMTALQLNDYNQTVNAKVASYTLVASDAGTRITMSNASATTITVNTSLFAAGDTLFITNIGAGACTITAGTATVSTASSLVLAQYDSGSLYFTSAGVAIWQKYQGATAASGSMTSLASGSLSGSSLVLSSISQSYKDLRLRISAFVGTTDDFGVTIALNAGAGNFSYAQDLASTRTLNGDFNTSSTRVNNQGLRNVNGSNQYQFDLFNYAASAGHLGLTNLGSGQSTGVQQYFLSGGYYNQNTTAVSSITFALTAGTFSAGTYILYGVN